MTNADFSFAWQGAEGAERAWEHLRVVHFSGREAISELYRYELTLLAKDSGPDIDPRDLIGRSATLRLETASTPEHRVVHGILVEAEDEADVHGTIVRVVLVPPLVRAQHRKRCRIFLEKTTRQIVDAVLQGDPRMQLAGGATVEPDQGGRGFAPADELYTWRVRDVSRIDDVRVRPYVVQYNESDLDFIARLLEEEGISYHFENGKGRCLLVLTDNDRGRARLEPDEPLGDRVFGRQVKSLRLGARLRAGAVVLDDYNWKKPNLAMAATERDGSAGDLVEYVYPGGYPDAPGQGAPLAKARVDRYHVEARYALGEGPVRVLSAGSIFKLHHDESDHEGEYLVTRIEVRGQQQGALGLPSQEQTETFHARFECARRGAGKQVEESRFRPLVVTRRPRIRGAQTALVTADPSSKGAEINVGGPDGISVGCVRLQFHWDTEAARLAKEPSSAWARVSQVFAGIGEGAVWHPRVGCEVIVNFEEGDPDRPIVVGRVYNGANLPPHTGAPVSAMKSLATPGGAVNNEIRFNDSAGGELLHYNAGKDQHTDVANNRIENIAANASMSVGANNTESIGANCTVTVGANDTLIVGADQTILVGANSTTVIGANSTKDVGASESNIIGACQTISVGATLTETVGGAVLESYGASRTTSVTGAVTEAFGAILNVDVGANVTESCATHTLDVGAARLMAIGGNVTTTANGAVTENIGAAYITLSGGSQSNTVSGGVIRNTPLHLTVTPFKYEDEPGVYQAAGFNLALTGLSLKLAAMSCSVYGAKVALTGLKVWATGVSLSAYGASLTVIGALVCTSAVDLQVGGAELEA